MTDPGQGDANGGDGGQEEAGEVLDGEVLSPGDGQAALQLVKQLADIEGRRIGVQEGKNQVAMRALEVNEKSDLRQFEFHRERLASNEQDRKRSHTLARLVILYGGGAVLLIVALILGMAFFGDTAQSEIAMTMVKEGAKWVGGAGFIFMVATGLRRLLRSDPPSR